MISLELMEKEDLQKIIEWNTNKSADYLLQWAGPKFTYPLMLDELERYFMEEVHDLNSDILLYKIILVSTNEIIGTIELREIDKVNKIARVCRFLIGKNTNRAKGIGKKVLEEILRNGFEDRGLEKITLGVFDFNTSAIKCYEKVGFIKKNFIENARKSSTGYWNLYEMAISKDEWRSKYE